MNKGSILLVDDDYDLCRSFIKMMEFQNEFQVHWETSVTRAINTARTLRFDLLIMEVGFPDMDGREAVRILRKGGFTAPIVMLTSKSSDSDIILGLEFGANDYVTKPFSFPVFMARIRALLRQQGQSMDATFPVGKFTFRPSHNRLVEKDNGRTVLLTNKETAVLKYLYRAGPHVISEKELLKEVWGYNSRTRTHTLQTHIYRLRQKIETNPAESTLLVTVDGGYKLVP